MIEPIEAALAYAGDARLLVAKSLTTLNTDVVAERSLRAIELDGADHGLANVEHLPLPIDAVRRFAA